MVAVALGILQIRSGTLRRATPIEDALAATDPKPAGLESDSKAPEAPFRRTLTFLDPIEKALAQHPSPPKG